MGFSKHAEKFLRKCDLSVHTMSNPGKHLRMDAPQVLAVSLSSVRRYQGGVERNLCLWNFGQAWIGMYVACTTRHRTLQPST